MIIAPDKVDAYLNAKGITPRMSDVQWSNAISVLSGLLKEGRGFRVKLLHQQEDPLRRFSSSFPDSVPQPYRFLDYVEFVAGSSLPEESVVAELTGRGVPFRLVRKQNGPDEDDVVTLVHVGPAK